jgi:hypothetical protein
MPDTALSFYKKKHAEYSDKLKRIIRSQRIYVFMRLALFILTVSLPLLFLGDHLFIAILLFVSLLTVFLLLVRRFVSLENRRKYVACLLDVNLHEIEALRGNLTSFDDGSEYIDTGHHFSYDLDIFGPDSLFHYLNRCVTLNGKDCLAEMLLKPSGEAPTIKRRQKAFRELSKKTGFCQHFIATGRMYRDDQEDRIRLLKYVNLSSRFTRNHRLVVASKALPALTLGSLALVIAGILPFFAFITLFLVQLFITGAMLKNINEMHDLVTRRLNSLKKNGKLLQIIETARFDAPLLKSLQRYLKSEGMPPSGHIRRLSKIVEAFDNRLNFIAAVLLNGLLLWDINCVLLLERWNRRHREKLPVWLDSISRMEAYISFAVFYFNNPDFVFPCPQSEGPVIEASCLGHPLILPKERVCNDLLLEETGRFIVVTGANMAGKSTFLRTAGVALVLAMAGAPVCAREFRFRIMEVWSSMRTSDSLSRHESYFYAELKRLKQLIERIAGGTSVFVLLDEILKGTNTTDKQRGSVALLERMIKMGSSGIVATHDLSLAGLEKDYPGRIINKCFEVEIDGDKIKFDYLLRDGITAKMNALILMKQMGLLIRC